MNSFNDVYKALDAAMSALAFREEETDLWVACVNHTLTAELARRLSELATRQRLYWRAIKFVSEPKPASDYLNALDNLLAALKKTGFCVEITDHTVLFEQDGVTATIPLSRLANDLYRVEAIVPILDDVATYGDIIDAATGIDGALIFRRVARKSKYTRHAYIVKEKTAHSVELKTILKKVTELGGIWDIVFGGCVYVLVPEKVCYDPTEEISKLNRAS